MKRYIPHITFFASLVILLIVGVAANIIPLAYFFGALGAVWWDPPILIGGILIGAIIREHRYFLPVAIVFGLLASIIISNMNASLGAQLSLNSILARVAAVVGLAYIANFARLQWRSGPEKGTVLTYEAKLGLLRLAELAKVFRNHFGQQWIWRLFLVLQGIGILLLIYLDTSNRLDWDFFPDLNYNRRIFSRRNWDFFNGFFWGRYNYNWLALLYLAGPYMIARATGWVLEAKNEEP